VLLDAFAGFWISETRATHKHIHTITAAAGMVFATALVAVPRTGTI
jgi:hypothetical protein